MEAFVFAVHHVPRKLFSSYSIIYEYFMLKLLQFHKTSYSVVICRFNPYICFVYKILVVLKYHRTTNFWGWKISRFVQIFTEFQKYLSSKSLDRLVLLLTICLSSKIFSWNTVYGKASAGKNFCFLIGK